MPIEITPQTQDNALPLGQSTRDLEYILTTNAEQFKRLYPELEFYPMNRTETYLDTTYGESKVKSFPFEKPILVPVYVIIGPQEKLLRKYGIEVSQEAVAIFNNRIDLELKIDPITGDRLKYYNITFEILHVKHTDYYSNTQVPLNKIVTLRNLNDSTVQNQTERQWYLKTVDP
jgi:hypothetical protein